MPDNNLDLLIKQLKEAEAEYKTISAEITKIKHTIEQLGKGLIAANDHLSKQASLNNEMAVQDAKFTEEQSLYSTQLNALTTQTKGMSSKYNELTTAIEKLRQLENKDDQTNQAIENKLKEKKKLEVSITKNVTAANRINSLMQTNEELLSKKFNVKNVEMLKQVMRFTRLEQSNMLTDIRLTEEEIQTLKNKKIDLDDKLTKLEQRTFSLSKQIIDARMVTRNVKPSDTELKESDTTENQNRPRLR